MLALRGMREEKTVIFFLDRSLKSSLYMAFLLFKQKATGFGRKVEFSSETLTEVQFRVA